MMIGICGKSGSGKSTLAKQIMSIYGDRVVHLDVDKIGHKILTMDEVKEELVRSFGKEIIDEPNVDRKELGNIVFNSRDKMKTLSDITWKYMQIEIDKFLSDNRDRVVILDWILLPITKYFDMCDLKILLDIPYEIRKQRAMKRDNITEEAFDLREKASIEFNYENFDFVLKDNEEETLQRLVKFI